MNRKSLAALGLILGFSANSVFAENATKSGKEYNSMLDRLTQVQRNATDLRSASLDALLNTKTETTKSMGEAFSYTSKRRTSRQKRRRIPKTKKVKTDSSERKKTVREKFDELKRLGRLDSDETKESLAKGHGKAKKFRVHGERLSKRESNIFRVIKYARNLDELSSTEKSDLLALHRKMLKNPDVRALLDTIQKGEGGKPLVIVGNGKRKSAKFKKIMNNLDFSTHPAYQFPKDMRCFYYNKQVGKCSTASGNYQITKTNFDYYRRQLGLKDFSVETQQIIALELIRTGKAKIVKGNYKGRGYVELIKGNLRNAVRYGTNDWASSPFSEWGGHKTDYLKDAKTIAKNIKEREPESMKDRAYYQNWLDEFEKDAS